ncbi:MAG: T9SS type A sorting domain-containing protein, partial [Chitinophagaceae bacterium]
YFAKVMNSGCNSDPSNVIWINEPNLSIPEFRGQKVSIYPNPTEGKFTLNFSSGKTTNGLATFYSVTGQKLRTVELTQNAIYELDITNFSDGIYFLCFQFDSGEKRIFRINLVR